MLCSSTWQIYFLFECVESCKLNGTDFYSIFTNSTYGNISITVSNKLDIIGIDIDTIITFPPISILFAIALSPESLLMLTANSVKNAIPVIFISNVKKSLLIAVLFYSVVSKFIIARILSVIRSKIVAPVKRDMYNVNSGLYCLIIIMIIKEISPIPIIFKMSILLTYSFLNAKVFHINNLQFMLQFLCEIIVKYTLRK